MLAQILGFLPRMTIRESKEGQRNSVAAGGAYGWLGAQHLPAEFCSLGAVSTKPH